MTPLASTDPLQRAHIVGIGGAGMSGIARLLLARSAQVSGSDAKESRRVDSVRALGAVIAVGHAASNLDLCGEPRCVIISTAIAVDNPEVVEAQKRGIPVLHRAEALAAVMADSRVLAVAGTHGKTTTTSMLTVALQNCGADPSFAIGSELNESGSNAHLGTGDVFVAEADESDGSFLRLGSFAGIVTNVEPDHLNYWGTFEAVEQGFVDFATGIRDRGGFLVACLDDEGAARLIGTARAQGVRVLSYGMHADADYRIDDPHMAGDRWEFEVTRLGVRLGLVRLQVPGEHNILNSTAALAMGVEMGFPESELRAGIETFSGTRRRFEYRGTADGVRVYDDYAHHPTEIAATLRAARSVVGDGRLVVAFQAHHYYRTALFVREFGEALGLADEVVVLEVFAPGEEPIPGASGRTMADNVPLPPEQVAFEPSWSKVAGQLAARSRPGDVVMTLGAGDIGMLAPEVLDLLRAREGQQ